MISDYPDEAGTSLVELIVTSAVGALALAGIYATMWGFVDDVAAVNQRSLAQTTSLPVMHDLTVELREAAAPDLGDPLLLEVRPDRLRFHSDAHRAEGIEVLDYRLLGCAEARCELWKTVTGAAGSVLVDRPLIAEVIDPATSGIPLFRAIALVDSEWVNLDACVAPDCDAPLVGIDMRVGLGSVGSGDDDFEIAREVRLRNASLR